MRPSVRCLHALRLLLLLALSVLPISAWSAVRVAILGDSNTWIGGDDNSRPKGWNYWLALDTVAFSSCRSYARSGATWTHTVHTRHDTQLNTALLHDSNVIYNQVQRLHEAVLADSSLMPQLIIVSAGGNDASFQHRRPGIFSEGLEQVMALPDSVLLSRSPSQVTSLTGCIRYDVLLLRRFFPSASIVLVTPFEHTNVTVACIQDISSRIEAVGEQLHVPVLRLDLASPIRAAHEQAQRRLTSDGIHTTPQGAQANARVFLQWLRQLTHN